MMKVVVLGASPKPNRYSYRATKLLKDNGYQVIAIGNRDGDIEGVKILKQTPQIKDVHTITLYLNPRRQEQYYDWILSLKPKRVIFNPGTENPVLQKLLEQNNIPYIEACTIVMLTIGAFEPENQ